MQTQLRTHPITSSSEREFQALLAIYKEAHPPSERKSEKSLLRMLQSPNYLFMVATDPLANDAVRGFTITANLSGTKACLLEYMAVDRDHRNTGIGHSLFEAVRQQPECADCFLLMEVDSDNPSAPDTIQITQRQNFYRALGCRRVEGLAYQMPSVSGALPPSMEIFVFSKDLPQFVERRVLQTWLEQIYQDVYALPTDDPRIDQMVASLPNRIRLI